MTGENFENVDGQRSRNMAAIKSKDTKPELIVRKIVRSLGVGYRLHRKDIPGKPDLAFIGLRKAIFVHGCFWHQHDNLDCTLSHVPKSRLSYWGPKFKRNKQRDVKNLEELKADAWEVLVVWECETKDLENLSLKLKEFLSRVA